MVARKTLSFAVLAVLFSSCLGQGISNPCLDAKTCDQCITASPDCLWCSTTATHCNSRLTYNVSTCPGGGVDDPLSVINRIVDEPLSNASVLGVQSKQVRPQVVNITLRRDSPQSFNMSFIALRNTPLDVYFLLDSSASLASTIGAIQNNLQEIARTIEDISTGFQIGIGGFVEKDVFPYAGIENYHILFGATTQCRSTGNICNIPFGFRHVLKLTNNVTAFEETLNSSVGLAINVDEPEGGMDALLQVAVCKDIIGWRDNALHMVFLITDNEFHTAGDGALAGLVRPNDGACHLEEIPDKPGQYVYTHSTIQDYPSIFQVLGALEQQVIVPIFGVQQGRTDDTNILTYIKLATSFRSVQSAAFPVVTNGVMNNVSTAQQIIRLIQNSYERTSQTILVNTPQVPGYNITIEPLDCNVTDSDGACQVGFDDVITFKVTVELTDCSMGNKKVVLSGAPYTFSTLNLEPVCACNCSNDEFQVLNSDACNNNGTEVCGACACNEGRFGDKCQCDVEVLDCPIFNMEQCGGEERGTCTACGVCVCNEPFFFGAEQGCRCDNTSCLNRCNDKGKCLCGSPPQCDCTALNVLAPISNKPFFGDACECNPDDCTNENMTSIQCRVIGSTATGACGCKGCDCSETATGIPGLLVQANMCVYEDICSFFQPCVSCRSKITSECDNPNIAACEVEFEYQTLPRDEPINTVRDYAACMFEVNGCMYEFYIGRHNPYTLPIRISEVTSCMQLPIWAPYVIGAAILIAIIMWGLLFLIILKACFVLSDRFEYGKFTQELQHADFAPHENPLYLTPNQEYQNPILRRPSKRSN